MFSVERNVFPLAALFLSSIFTLLGAFFVVTLLLFLIFQKFPGGLCNTKKLLPCVSPEKKGLEVFESTFVAFGTFSLLDWFYIWLRVSFDLNVLLLV